MPYVIPVPLTRLERGTRESEGSPPSTGLGGILGKRKLTLVAIPGTEEVGGLDVGRSAEGER